MFAAMIRSEVKTLQNWEQHRRNPTGAAAALLTISIENRNGNEGIAWLGLRVQWRLFCW